MNKDILKKDLHLAQFSFNLPLSLTVICFLMPVVYLSLFFYGSSQVSSFCNQSFAYCGNSKNNLPPQTNDGGSRFSQPQQKFDSDFLLLDLTS